MRCGEVRKTKEREAEKQQICDKGEEMERADKKRKMKKEQGRKEVRRRQGVKDDDEKAKEMS